MRALVVRFGPIGDMLRMLPLFHSLKASFPGGRTAWAADFSALGGLLEGHPDLDRLLSFPRRGWSPANLAAFYKQLRAEPLDAALDMQGNFRSAAIAALSPARRVIGVSPSHEGARLFHHETIAVQGPLWFPPLRAAAERLGARWNGDWHLPLPAEALAFADSFFTERVKPAGAPAVFLFPGSRRSAKHGDTRRWPEENFIALGRRLRAATGAAFVIGHGPGEEALARRIAAGIGEGALLPPPAALPRTAALIARCRLYIGGDTGISHLAWLLRKPSVMIFRVQTHQAPPEEFGLPLRAPFTPPEMPPKEAVALAEEAALALWARNA